ncbi:MAG: hypothetical protein O2899_00445 [Bacteroidetes bacterium]|nr:hypothetical protein [Bacteroidota bacterium]
MNRTTFLPLLLCLFFSACDATDPSPGPDAAKRILVVNGGNFSDQNGHLTAWDPSSGTTRQLPDQAGFLHGIHAGADHLMVLVNTFNGGRVDILDAGTLELVDQWTGMDAPRDALISESDAWLVTSTFGSPGKLLRLDPVSGGIRAEFQVGEVPESIAGFADRIVVANNGSLGSGNTLSAVDPVGGTVTTHPVACDGPRELFPYGDQLIVVCSGETVYSSDFSEVLSRTHGRILFLDATLSPSTTLDLTAQPGSTNGTDAGFLDATTGHLYLTLSTGEEILVVDVRSRRMATSFQVASDASWTGLSGIAHDPATGHTYVGRFPTSAAGPFPDYASAGSVWILDGGGASIGSFTVGASPSAILIQ